VKRTSERVVLPGSLGPRLVGELELPDAAVGVGRVLAAWGSGLV